MTIACYHYLHVFFPVDYTHVQRGIFGRCRIHSCATLPASHVDVVIHTSARPTIAFPPVVHRTLPHLNVEALVAHAFQMRLDQLGAVLLAVLDNAIWMQETTGSSVTCVWWVCACFCAHHWSRTRFVSGHAQHALHDLGFSPVAGAVVAVEVLLDARTTFSLTAVFPIVRGWWELVCGNRRTTLGCFGLMEDGMTDDDSWDC